MISFNLRAVKYYIKDLISKNPELATFIYSNREKLSLRVHRNRLALYGLAEYQFNQSLFDESMYTYLKYMVKYYKETEQNISVSISPIMSVKNYCLNTKQMYHTLVEEKLRYINKPVIWSHLNDPEFKIPIVQPEIYLAAISDALVVGGNNIIHTKDNVILYDIATEKNADKYELRD